MAMGRSARPKRSGAPFIQPCKPACQLIGWRCDVVADLDMACAQLARPHLDHLAGAVLLNKAQGMRKTVIEAAMDFHHQR